MGRLTTRMKMTRSLRPWDTSHPSSESSVIWRRHVHPPPFFGRVSYGRRLLDQLCLQHYGVYDVIFLKSCPLTSAQRACAHLSRLHLTRRYSWGVLHLYGAITPYISICDYTRMFSIGNVVLDPWSDHVFHIRRVNSSDFLLPYLNAGRQGRQLLRLSALSPQQAVCA